VSTRIEGLEAPVKATDSRSAFLEPRTGDNDRNGPEAYRDIVSEVRHVVSGHMNGGAITLDMTRDAVMNWQSVQRIQHTNLTVMGLATPNHSSHYTFVVHMSIQSTHHGTSSQIDSGTVLKV